MPVDTEAALEWAEWKASLCSGCGIPKDESFHPDNVHAFEATALECGGCAARERKAWNDNQARDSGQPPMFGRFYAVSLDEEYLAQRRQVIDG